jgi:SnoaL-like domain
MPTEDQVRQLIDRQEITALKYRYLRSCDALDIPEILSGFTDDCHVDFWPGSGTDTHGLVELESFYTAALAGIQSSSHHLSNIDVVFQSPDRAAMFSYLYSWTRNVNYPEVADHHRFARYLDVFVRTPGGWRQSKLTYLVAGELADVDNLRVGEQLTYPKWTGRES